MLLDGRESVARGDTDDLAPSVRCTPKLHHAKFPPDDDREVLLTAEKLLPKDRESLTFNTYPKGKIPINGR